jgi:hypothetical protein
MDFADPAPASATLVWRKHNAFVCEVLERCQPGIINGIVAKLSTSTRAAPYSVFSYDENWHIKAFQSMRHRT